MKLSTKLIVYSSLIAGLAGCSSLSLRDRPSTQQGTTPGTQSAGGYYLDDGPGGNPPADLASVPDAVPRDEPPHRYANRPYTVKGRQFTPIPGNVAYRANGKASWYGRRFHGKPTSSGEPYDMYAMTAAHPTLPIPSYARVSNPRNGRSVIVRINDRGPFHEDRLIDLSYTAAWKLDLLRGVEEVEVTKLMIGEDVSPAMAERPSASGLYLQLAALSSPGAVDTLIRRVREADIRLPGLYRVASDDLIKVQAGPFGAPEEASIAAELIERNLGLKPFRVTH